MRELGTYLVAASTDLKGLADSLVAGNCVGATMSAREVAVKKYVVRLSQEERKQLDEMIRKGKSSAQKLMKARILLKADISEGGEAGATAGSRRRWRRLR
jgi:hypothetical protein